MECKTCGSVILEGKRLVYCDKCNEERIKERALIIATRKDRFYRPENDDGKWVDKNCVQCGKLIKMRHRQKLCPICYEINKIKGSHPRYGYDLTKAQNNKYTSTKKVKSNSKSISEIAREARRLGLNYGYYAAMMEG